MNFHIFLPYFSIVSYVTITFWISLKPDPLPPPLKGREILLSFSTKYPFIEKELM